MFMASGTYCMKLFILGNMYAYVFVSQLCLTLCDPPGPLSVGFSGQESCEVSRHSLLQGIFLCQGSNQGVLHCRQILYHQEAL